MSLEIKPIYQFGQHRLDPAQHLLFRNGEVVPLPPKAFDLLQVLVEHHGRLLEKEELMKAVWAGIFVEEANLSYNISLIRRALEGNESGQRLIENVPKRGYRFVATVTEVLVEPRRLDEQDIQSQRTSPSAAELATRASPRPSHPEQRGWLWVISATLLAGFATFLYLWTRPLPAPRVLRTTPITYDGKSKSMGLGDWFQGTNLATDGSRIYFTNEVDTGREYVARVSSTGGETVRIPAAFQQVQLQDISPDGSELLVVAARCSDLPGPLWVVPTLGGTSRGFGDIVATNAAWSPDGKHVAYSNANKLFLARSDGSQSRKLADLPGRGFHLRWAPDARHLRLTIAGDFSASLWQIAADGSDLRPLLSSLSKGSYECCGHWTPDGKYFVFLSTREGATNIWAIREQKDSVRKADREPVQLTAGPLNFYNLVPSRDGQKLFAVGVKQRGELVRYDSQAGRFEPYLGGISAQFLDFTSDGQWVTYVSYPQGSLWRSRVDGSDRLQLTFPPMVANLPRWSPDGKRIAFSGWAAPGRPAKIYLISATGGAPEQAIPEDRDAQYDVSWSPDGNSLAWGRLPWESDSSHPIAIQILDLKTHQISTLPGSRMHFHPAWSPDGKNISAYHVDWHMVLFDFTTKEWKDLTELPADYSEWSQDGKYIYFASPPGINRVRITDGRVEKVVSLKEFRPAWDWIGLTPKDAPLALRDVGSEEIYALDVDFP